METTGEHPRRPKLLVIGKYFPPFNGGVESVTLSNCLMLKDLYDITVVVNAHEPSAIGIKSVEGIKVYCLGVAFTYASQPVALGLWRKLQLSSFDVVHLHGPNPYAAALMWFKWLMLGRRRPKLVVTHHMDIRGRRLLRLASIAPYRRLLLAADSVVVTSRRNAERSADIPTGVQVMVVPPHCPEPPVAPYKFHVDFEVSDKEIAGWDRTKPTLLFLGRLAPYKGLTVLLNALTRLPSIQCIVAGDGALRPMLDAQIARSGLSERVFMLGAISERQKAALFSQCDLFVFPSIDSTEAFGVALLEAMIAGLPVIASALDTGVADVAVDGISAVTFPPGDDEALASSITQLLADPRRRERLAETARLYALSNFGAAKVQELLRMAFRIGGSGQG
jgi:glycosyltransferase involved in cell wall biosynthesis